MIEFGITNKRSKPSTTSRAPARSPAAWGSSS